MLHQTEKVQVAQGIGQHDSRAGVSWSFCISARLGGIRSGVEIQTEILNALPCSGMDGKYDGKILRQFLQTRKNAQKTIPIVHIRWAMQSQQRVRANWLPFFMGPDLSPNFSQIADSSALSLKARRESIIVLPTRCTQSSEIPSLCKF